MKLRYQMRGLGIGIIVTALLMGVVKGEKLPLSDAEIKAKALELGMVESDSMKLSDIPGGQSSDDSGTAPDPGGESDGREGAGSGSEPDADPGEEGSGAPEGEGDSDTGGDSGDEEEGSAPHGSQEDAEGNGQDAGGTPGSARLGGTGAEGERVTVVIEEGVTSYSVCELLEELGLIEDADSLDYYICSNSYSRSIQEGVYEIPRGTSDEEIVSIIMGNR